MGQKAKIINLDCRLVNQNQARTYIKRGLAESAACHPRTGKITEIRLTDRAITMFKRADAGLPPPERLKSKQPLQASSLVPGRTNGRHTKTLKPLRLPATGPTPEELHWRESVLVRDGFRCVHCGSTNELEADHIKPKYLYPELRFDVANGRTLCFPCHKETPTFGSKVRRLTAYEEQEIVS